MKNKLILGLLIIVGIGFFSYISQPREVYCEKELDIENTQKVILNKSKQGWKLVSLVSYQAPNSSASYFILTMEK